MADDTTSRSLEEALAATVQTSSRPEPTTPINPDLIENRRVGRYEIVGLLGSGGMGVVYRAFDPELQRHVAIKLVRPERANDDESRVRVVREARALARINHPNVVGVYDVGEHEGEVFVATELVEGETLADWQKGKPLADLIRAWVQACRGLSAVHAVGVVHRDVKPANVLVGRDGRIRIGDFGIAHQRSDALRAAEVAMTVPGPLTTTASMIAGTPAYMAPEQHAGKVDPRSDQFSACVSIVEALTQRRPAADEEVTIEPRALAAVLTRGLRNDIEQRFRTIDAFADALGGALESPRAPKRRWKLVVASVGCAGVASVATIALWPTVSDREGSGATGSSASAGSAATAGSSTMIAAPRTGTCTIPGLAFPTEMVVLAAGGYTGRELGFQIDDSGHTATVIDTIVSTPGPVALVLGAYEPTIWNLRWTEATRIVAVIATGYHRQAIAGLPPGVPTLISTQEGTSKCSYFDDVNEQRSAIDEIVQAALGRAVNAVYDVDEDAGKVVLGNPTNAKLTSSTATRIGSFRDPNSPLAGAAGLDILIEEGLLRRATVDDIAKIERLLRSNKRKIDDFEILRLQGDSVFVVVGKFKSPDGLHGAHSVTFIVPRGKPRPTGDNSHNKVIDLNEYPDL